MLSGHLTPRERWIATGSLLLGMVAFTTAIMAANVVLPQLMTSLRADLDQAQWILTAPAIAQTVVMPMVGWLTSLMGHRLLFLGSMALFCVSSVLSAMAWSLTSLVVFQSLGGIGVGLMQPIIAAIMYQIFPPQQRGLALGLSLMGWSIGPAIGPIAGGYLVEWFNWRAAFYFSVPLGIAGLICAFLYLPDMPRPERKNVDHIGLLTMSVGLIALLMALSQGRREGWDSSYIVTLFAIATLCLMVFVAWELLYDSPLVDLRLFRFLPFSLACLVVFVSTCAFRGTGVLTIVYMQQVLEFTPLRVGWLLLAGNLAYGLAVVAAGRMADRIDPSISVIAGLWVFALGFFYFATMNETITTFVLIVLLTSRLASYGMVGSPNNLSAMRAIPETEVVMASGLFALIRGIAGAIGPVVSATYLDQRYAFHTQRYADQPDPLSWSMQHAQTGVYDVLRSAGEMPALLSDQTAALMHQRLLAEATTAAYQDYFIISALAAVAGMLPALPWEKLPDLWRKVWRPATSQPIPVESEAEASLDLIPGA
jgi:MFS transporter, DHA2 family, multidrug resistance protein